MKSVIGLPGSRADRLIQLVHVLITGHRWWTMFKFVSPHQRTPLHTAARGGSVDIVKLLVQKGANLSINVRDVGGVSE